MAYVPTFNDNLRYLKGVGPEPLFRTGAPAEPPESGNQQATTQEFQPQATPPAPGESQTLTSSPPRPLSTSSPPAGGNIRDQLISPISAGVGEGRTELERARAAFESEAGPRRSYESIGGQGILDQALAGPGQETQARGLVTAEYRGPQGLSVTEPTNALRARSQALTRGGQLASLIGTTARGITGGEADYEARNLLRDQGYRSQARGAQAEYGQLAQEYATAARGAEEYAQGRRADETGIRESSRGYLSGEAQEIEQALSGRLAQAEAANRETADRYARAQTDPSLLSGFDTPGRQAQERARTAREAVMRQFQDISHIDPAELGITDTGLEKEFFELGGRGYQTEPALRGEVYARPGETHSDLPEGMTQEEFRRIAGRVHDRQSSLESLFAPETSIIGDAGVAAAYPEWTQRQAGEFSLYDPLYFRGEIGNAGALPDPRNFARLDPGMAPNRENLATAAERDRYNRAQGLLGANESLGAVDPYQAAQIISDIEGFRAAEEDALRRRREAAGSAEQDWRNRVESQRDAFEQAHDFDPWQVAAGWGLTSIGAGHLGLPLIRRGL